MIIGNYDKAEKLFSKLLDRFRRLKLGENDPYVLAAMRGLAITYDRQGKHIDAEVLLKQCLDKQKVVLGESHPDTLNTMSILAGTYDDQGSIESLRSYTSSA